MTRKIFFSLCFIFSFISLKAQYYHTSIGGRLGNPFAVSYKMFANENIAYEGFIGLDNDVLFVNAAMQLHQDIREVDRLKWYYGAGGGLAFFDDGLAVGINGFIGLEYVIENTPLNVSLDWVPTIFIGGGGSGFTGSYGALGVRYILAY